MYTTVIERGSTLLNQKRPGWREEIVVEKLDIGSGERCVLGQLYGSFDKGSQKLGIFGEQSGHGFAIGGGPGGGYTSYEELTTEWIREIQNPTVV